MPILFAKQLKQGMHARMYECLRYGVKGGGGYLLLFRFSVDLARSDENTVQ